MSSYFIYIVILIFFIWLGILIFRVGRLDNGYINLGKDIENLVEKIYIDIVSFERCKNFTKALQKNLRHHIDNFIILYENKSPLIVEYLDCLKDTVDINDMTFYVGNDLINILLRKKVRECFYRNITLDVVADLSEVSIRSDHLFFIFLVMVDLAIKYLSNNEDQDRKTKILIRSSMSNLENSNFFVLKIAYDIISDDIKDIDINLFDKEYHDNIFSLLLDYYNGIIINDKKNGRFIKTIAIPSSR